MRSLPLLLTAFALSLGACHSAGRADKMAHDTAGQVAGSAGPGSTGSQQDTSRVRDDPSTAGDDSVNLTKLRARFADAPLPFAGLWVNEHYVDEIRQGKSLRESQDTATRAIVIPDRTLQVTRIIFGFHDSGAGLVFTKKDGAYYMCFVYDGQCNERLQFLPDGRLRMGGDLYIHVGEVDEHSSDLGVLERLLFAGKYTSPEAAGPVVFEADGRVKGLDVFAFYEPVVDYADLNTHVDHIRLGMNRKEMVDYGMRFAGDSLMIYSIDCRKYDGDECVDDTLGRRLYVLTRVRS